MKFTIKIRDTENGSVRVDCEPGFDIMAQIAREKADRLTPAAAYALGALAHIKKASIENHKQMLAERYESGSIPMFDATKNIFK